jgi:translation elongation factor EF-4
VIIAGESGSGKTVLMYFLAKREMCKTVSSITTNDCKFKFDKDSTEAKMVRFVDIPGHVNFREDVYSELDSAKGIVYLVDSSQK